MDPFSNRKKFIVILTAAGFFALSGKLFYIQIIDSSYKVSAESNSQRIVTRYPARGLIYDRAGRLIVSNQAAYDVMVNPSQLQAFDTAVLCKMLGITVDVAKRAIDSAFRFSRYQPSEFVRQISVQEYAVLQEQLHKFPGFFVQPRTLRKYHTSGSAHLLGYVGEVDKSIIKNDPYYRMGDYIGISGIEKAYEEDLRGRKGQEVLLVDVHGRVKGSFAEGKFDHEAIVGKDLYATMDLTLQEYGEKLMRNMRGSIVAIEPQTGEILALVSSPGFDPALLVGRSRAENYVRLAKDTLKPLFNRALMAKYPPGSTFKIINALVGLQEGVISQNTEFGCSMGIQIGGMFKRCHNHFSPLDLRGAIQNSCNSYFFLTFRNIIENRYYKNSTEAYNAWRMYVTSFGFGNVLGSDLPNELGGFVPTEDYYNRYYGKNRWNAYTIISLGIGQGELGITPLQMANYAAIIANRGYFVIPHSVKAIENKSLNRKFLERHYVAIDSSLFGPIIDGMQGAVNGPGTGTALIARLPDIIICGKTGTAQNPHGADHSIFIAFAPRDHPKIALSVYVENGGFGATYAAPVASLMIEKFLTDTITRPWLEQHVLNANLLYSNAPKRKNMVED